MNTSEIDNIEFDGIDDNDFPDFCDAFVSSADYDGAEMTPDQLDDLNENHRDFVSDQLISYFF